MSETTAHADYGICANVFETDRVFRMGAKAWLCLWTGGNDRCQWVAQARSGKWHHEKWAPIMRFHNFRAAYVPDIFRGNVFERGDRSSMEHKAHELEKEAEALRTRHPNRRLGFIELQRS